MIGPSFMIKFVPSHRIISYNLIYSRKGEHPSEYVAKSTLKFQTVVLNKILSN